MKVLNKEEFGQYYSTLTPEQQAVWNASMEEFAKAKNGMVWRVLIGEQYEEREAAAKTETNEERL